MIGLIQRYFRRRRLRPLVATVPWALEKSYGPSGRYTIGQVRRCLERLKLSPELLPAAAAAYCDEDEYHKLEGTHSEHQYRTLRDDIDLLFGIEDPHFTAETIRKKRIRQTWNPNLSEHPDPRSPEPGPD